MGVIQISLRQPTDRKDSDSISALRERTAD